MNASHSQFVASTEVGQLGFASSPFKYDRDQELHNQRLVAKVVYERSKIKLGLAEDLSARAEKALAFARELLLKEVIGVRVGRTVCPDHWCLYRPE